MKTNREAISDIINDLRKLSIDDRISERFVLSKLKEFNALYLKRENDKRRLFYYDDIWQEIPCIEMKEVDYINCGNINAPRYIRYTKSVEPLPEFYTYANGNLIRDVVSIDGGYDYQPLNERDYRKVLKREFSFENRYYWITNGHLVIPNGPLKVTVTGCFIDPDKAEMLNSCNKESCINVLDHKFPCPAHLYAVVRQETTKDLFSFYNRNIIDELPDMDNNIKSESQIRK